MNPTLPLPPRTRYVKRSEWGLTDAEADRRGMKVQPRRLPRAFVHHSGGNAPDMTAAVWDDDPIAWIQASDRSARDEGHKGYLYSWGIHQAPSGWVTIIEGREDRYPGATKGMNPVSKAICYAGNYDSRYGPDTRRRPSQTELDAGRWLVSNLIAADVLARDVIGLGHTQNPACLGCTACPGDLLLPSVPYIFTPWQAVVPPTTVPGGTVLHAFDPHIRIADTRDGTGKVPVGKLAAGQPLRVAVPAISGVERPLVAIVNVTTVEPTGPGFHQVAGSTFGGSSTGNLAPGLPPVATPCIVPIIGGAIQVQLGGASNPAAHIIVDLQGVVH